MEVSRSDLITLLALGLGVAGLEGMGVSLLIPVLRYVEQGSIAVDARLWRVVSTLPISPLPALLMIAFAPILARQIVRYVHQVRAETVRFRAIGRLRSTGFAAILNGELPFCASERQGRLVNALTSQIEWGAASLPYVLQIAEAAILLAVYTMVLAFVAPWLIPLAVVAIASVMLLVRARVRASKAYGARVSAAFEALHVTVAEKLAGIRLVKVRVEEKREAEAHALVVDDLTSTLIALARQKEAIEVAIEPMMVLGAFVALYVAVAWFGMTLAGLGIVMFALLRMVPYLKQMTASAQMLGALTAGLEEVRTVIDTARRTRTIQSGHMVFSGLKRGITFDGVGFRYPDGDDRWAIRDLSFTLDRGTLTAIVGRSGAGKSTVLDLIARLREPSEGILAFDGIPAAAFDLGSLRSAIGIVDHQGFLFNDTVANNISYGVAGCSQAAVYDAARRAHADDFIRELPRGYETVVGDRGVRLSAGQRQRLSLARVLLQDPSVFLLDEPTSALDSESEEVIQATLAELARTKVVVVVAHRLSTIRRASQILVFEEGRIVERGDHRSLMNDEGAYRRFFDLQLYA